MGSDSPDSAPESSRSAKTHREVAEFFNMKVSTVQDWAKCGMPGSRGNYDLNEIAVWMILNGKGSKSQAKTDLVEDQLKRQAAEAVAQGEIDKAKKVAAEREMAERRNRLERGGWVRRHNVERFLTEFLTECRKLQNRMVVEFAAGYGAELESDLREDLQGRVENIQNQLGDYIEKIDGLEIEE